jgi:hypothetical protein
VSYESKTAWERCWEPPQSAARVVPTRREKEKERKVRRILIFGWLLEVIEEGTKAR